MISMSEPTASRMLAMCSSFSAMPRTPLPGPYGKRAFMASYPSAT